MSTINGFEIDMEVPPLTWPCGKMPMFDSRTTFHRFLWRVPFLGWELRNRHYEAIMHPVLQHINSQLVGRPPFNIKSSSDVRDIVIAVSDIIYTEIGWANYSFIPEDPNSILFWAHEDGLDGIAAIHRIEKHVDLKLPVGSDLTPTFKTFGQLIQYICQNKS